MKPILLSPEKHDRFTVRQKITYKDIVVPVGFVTNGADIPRLMWWYVPPNKTDILPAVVVHDYMCSIAKTKKEFEKADLYFSMILEELKISKIKKMYLLQGVKFYTKWIRKYEG